MAEHAQNARKRLSARKAVRVKRAPRVWRPSAECLSLMDGDIGRVWFGVDELLDGMRGVISLAMEGEVFVVYCVAACVVSHVRCTPGVKRRVSIRRREAGNVVCKL